MSTKDLARALLHLDAGQESLLPDPRQLTRDILRRDRQRVRLLAVLTGLLWLLAAAGLFLLVLSLHWYIRSVRIQEFEGKHLTRDSQAAPKDPQGKKPFPLIQPYLETGMLHHSIPVIAGSVVALFLAAFCTILLVLSSRRATLRQLNANLIEICDQLKQMRRQEEAGGHD
jgi:hypothetical protein